MIYLHWRYSDMIPQRLQVIALFLRTELAQCACEHDRRAAAQNFASSSNFREVWKEVCEKLSRTNRARAHVVRCFSSSRAPLNRLPRLCPQTAKSRPRLAAKWLTAINEHGGYPRLNPIAMEHVSHMDSCPRRAAVHVSLCPTHRARLTAGSRKRFRVSLFYLLFCIAACLYIVA